MDYILCILILLLVIIVFITNCDQDIELENNFKPKENFKPEENFKPKENFKIEDNFKPLTSTFLNGKYTLEEVIDNKNKFIKFKPYSNNNYAKIIEYEDNYKIKYYHIYINDMILSYIKDDKNITYYLKLMIPDNEAINGLFDKYRLYKTANNKLFFIINNSYIYLSIDTQTNYLTTIYDESKALGWTG